MVTVMNNYDKIISEKIKNAKERGYRKRGWIVLRKSWLTSSVHYRMNSDEKVTFIDLIILADELGPVPGLISDNDLRPIPYEYLAHLCFCTVETFESVVKKGIEDDAIYENSHGIYLTHFDDYQFTEYDRQKPYRERKKEKEKSGIPDKYKDV